MSAALILSGLWGLQPDPGAPPPAGPVPSAGWTPSPPPPHLRPRGHRRPPWVPPSPADGRGGRAMTGHLGTGAAGRRDGRLRPPAGLPGLRPPASRCSQSAGSGDSQGGAQPPRKSQPRPGRGSPWASWCGRDPRPPPSGELVVGGTRSSRAEGETEARGGRRLLTLFPVPRAAVPRPEVLTRP